MRLKRTFDWRPVPIVYTIEEAVKATVDNNYGDNEGQIETLRHQVTRLTDIVALMMEGRPVVDILPSFELATEADIKAYEERAR